MRTTRACTSEKSNRRLNSTDGITRSSQHVFVHELRDLYDAEQPLTKAVPLLAALRRPINGGRRFKNASKKPRSRHDTSKKFLRHLAKRSTSMLINTAGVQLDANMADFRFPPDLR